MMKRLFHIVLVLLLLSACGHRSWEMSEALLRAEEMNLNYQSMDTLTGMEQVADYYGERGTSPSPVHASLTLVIIIH